MATGQPATNLKARRESASMTPERLAQLANVSLRAILQAENIMALKPGPTNLTPTEMKRIADVLSTTLSDVRGF